MIAGIGALCHIMNGQSGINMRRAQPCLRSSHFRPGEWKGRLAGKQDRMTQYV